VTEQSVEERLEAPGDHAAQSRPVDLDMRDAGCALERLHWGLPDEFDLDPVCQCHASDVRERRGLRISVGPLIRD
jgi:hypothetical protein